MENKSVNIKVNRASKEIEKPKENLKIDTQMQKRKAIPNLFLTLSRKMTQISKKKKKKKVLKADLSQEKYIEELEKIVKTQRKRIQDLENDTDDNITKMRIKTEERMNSITQVFTNFENLIKSKICEFSVL